MTAPQYVNEISDVYAEMYKPKSTESVLEEKKSKDHDYDIPRWARILHKHKQEEKFKQGPHCAHDSGHVDAEEESEENDLVSGAETKLRELVGQISKLKGTLEEGDPLFKKITQIEGIEIN